MPPPTPNVVVPGVIVNVRIATAHADRARDASIHPTAPQYTPRRTGSRSSIACSTRGLGAPVTDAGGNVARISEPSVTPSQRRPRTVLTRWCKPGWGSTAHNDGTTTEP